MNSVAKESFIIGVDSVQESQNPILRCEESKSDEMALLVDEKPGCNLMDNTIPDTA